MKRFLKSIKYFYISLLCWIVLIILYVSIIFIPVALALKVNTDWFDEPFNEALIRIWR